MLGCHLIPSSRSTRAPHHARRGRRPLRRQAWLEALKRAAWLAKLPHEALGFRQHTMPTGFGSWVAGQTADGTPVPYWRSFLPVLVDVDPVVLMLTLMVAPRTAGLGMAFAMLADRNLSVAALEWAVMPLLNRVPSPWLEAHGRDGRVVPWPAQPPSSGRSSGWRWCSGS